MSDGSGQWPCKLAKFLVFFVAIAKLLVRLIHLLPILLLFITSLFVRAIIAASFPRARLQKGYVLIFA